MAQIDLDLTVPSDAIRAMVGDLDSCDHLMSNAMYDQLYDINNINSREECFVLWFAAIQASEIIMAHFAQTGQRYRERVNSVEVENYGSERYKNYQNLVKWLKNNPPKSGTSGGALFTIGGSYTECDTIYTLKYIKDCCTACWSTGSINSYVFT